MARILVFCYSASLAHAGRAVAVARALTAAGHDAIVAGSPRYLESSLLVDRGELYLEPLEEPPLEAVLASARGPSADSGAADGVAFAGAVYDELRLIEALAPDAVVVDNRRTAVISAEIARLPSLVITNASLLGPLSALEPTVRELAVICAPAFGQLPEEIYATPEFSEMDRDAPVPLRPIPLSPGIRDFLGTFPVAPRTQVHELCVGTRTAVADDPTLYPIRGGSPSSRGMTAVGPLLFDCAAALPPWWDQLDDARPIVYVTFGSTGGRARFEYAVEALAALRAQVVVTTADLLPVVPDGVFGCRYLPASQIMARADLVVCHGGSLTMYHAAAAGTPILAIPTHLEQAVETIPWVRAGACAVLAKSEVHPGSATLTSRAAAMLDDTSYRDAATALASRIDTHSAVGACVHAVQALLGAR